MTDPIPLRIFWHTTKRSKIWRSHYKKIEKQANVKNRKGLLSNLSLLRKLVSFSSTRHVSVLKRFTLVFTVGVYGSWESRRCFSFPPAPFWRSIRFLRIQGEWWHWEQLLPGPPTAQELMCCCPQSEAGESTLPSCQKTRMFSHCSVFSKGSLAGKYRTWSCCASESWILAHPNYFYTNILKIKRKELREKQSFDSFAVGFLGHSLI